MPDRCGRSSQAAEAHRLQHPQHAGRVHVGGELRRIETDLYVALRGQVVDFIGTDLRDDLYQAHRIAEIGVMEVEMRTALEMRDALPPVDRRTADDAVNLVAFFQQELGEVRTVLPGHARYQCFFTHIFSR